GRRSLLGRDLLARLGMGRRRRRSLVFLGLLSNRDIHHGLAAERVLGEQGKADEGEQERPEQACNHLRRGKRQAEPARAPLRILSERGAQIVDRLSHRWSRINAATIPRRATATAGPLARRTTLVCPTKKGGPPDRPSPKPSFWLDGSVRALARGLPVGGCGLVICRLVVRRLVACAGGRRRRRRARLDAVEQVVRHLQRLVVLGIRRHIGFRPGLLFAFALQMAAQRG